MKINTLTKRFSVFLMLAGAVIILWQITANGGIVMPAIGGGFFLGGGFASLLLLYNK